MTKNIMVMIACCMIAPVAIGSSGRSQQATKVAPSNATVEGVELTVEPEMNVVISGQPTRLKIRTKNRSDKLLYAPEGDGEPDFKI